MTNKEIGKAIWENINFNGGFYEENFEKWFEDCFAVCVEEAVANIDNGGCKFETGSFIEISKNISKDGRTHNIDFDKENFIEYFGKEKCFRMFTTQEDIEQDLLNFFSGSLIPEEYSEAQREMFYEAGREWDSIEVDPEGPTKEQDEELDEVLENHAVKILNLMSDSDA
jgi:hypothetical protein